MQIWQKELAKSITSANELAKKIKLTKSELNQVIQAEQNFGLLITPEYLKLLKKEKFNGPIHRQIVPTLAELKVLPRELVDPIGDNDFSPVKGLVHRYPDRVLIWPTKNCAVHCRFCFRKRIVGNSWALTTEEINRIIKYLKKHQEIEEIIFSGGDPFMLNDEQIFEWLKKIKQIKHVKRIRFHTRLFSALPSRFTNQFLKKLAKFKSIYLVLHLNHPSEITPNFLSAVKRARKFSLPLFSQSVLLKNINDSVKVLKELFTSLLNIGVKPYYLHQTDMVPGTSHFRTKQSEGVKLMRELQQSVSGLALPRFMVEIPKGKGKVPIDLEFIKQKTD